MKCVILDVRCALMKGTHHKIALGAVSTAENEVRVANELLQQLSVVCLPYSQRLVIGRCADILGVWVPADCREPLQSKLSF